MPLLAIWRDDLEREGSAVIPGVSSQDKAAQYTEKATQWVELFSWGTSARLARHDVPLPCCREAGEGC